MPDHILISDVLFALSVVILSGAAGLLVAIVWDEWRWDRIDREDREELERNP